MVKIQRKNIDAALQMYSQRLTQLETELVKITKQYDKKSAKIQQEIWDISEAMDVLEALDKEA